MRFLHALLAMLLALGASLPACASVQGCEAVTAAVISSHHHMAAPIPSAPRENGDRHAGGGCIGCAAELPEALAPVPPAAPLIVRLLWPQGATLASLSPEAPVRPPRILG